MVEELNEYETENLKSKLPLQVRQKSHGFSVISKLSKYCLLTSLKKQLKIIKKKLNLDPMQEPGSGHWVVKSGQLKNIGTGASELGDGTLIDAKIIGEPSRQGLVVQCDGEGVKSHKCFSAPDEGKTCMT